MSDLRAVGGDHVVITMGETRKVEVDLSRTLDDYHADIRAVCPSPFWTIVTIERRATKGEVPIEPVRTELITNWEVYVEPGVQDEPDPAKRFAARIGVRAENPKVALALLADTLRERFRTPA